MTAFLDLSGMTKRYGGTLALDSASLRAGRGEVHALLGENGAGKSTLVKALVGAIRRDAGKIVLDGEEARFRSPAEARTAGVVEIFQELTILPELSVAANIFLGRELRRGGLLSAAEMQRRARGYLEAIGVDIDVRRPAGAYSIAIQQMIEIARATSTNARVLVMDEPTSSLTPGEIESLFAVIRRLSQQGTTVLYISHRLDEVVAICSKATIMRDGRTVAEVDVTPGMDKGTLVRLMIGRSLETGRESAPAGAGRELMRVEGLRREGVFEDINMTLREGEIVGLFGLLGAGRTEVARALFAADRPDGGHVMLEGQPYRPPGPREAIARGVVLVPEDRKTQGVVLQMSVARNATIAVLDRLRRWGLLRPRSVRTTTADLSRRLRIKAPSPTADVSTLSGGNQQKVVLAKWIARGARVFLFDEPTRGVDVGAKREIYTLIRELAAQGCAILVISSETEEIREVCDRVLVMFRGRIRARLGLAEASDEVLLTHATGS